MRFAALLLVLVAHPLQAETYKWVDAKGVTNYSSTPPAGAARAKVIEERVSVMPADPSLASAVADLRAAAMRRQEYVEIEYLQRAKLAVEKDMLAMTIPDCPYRADCDGGYFPASYPYYYGPQQVLRAPPGFIKPAFRVTQRTGGRPGGRPPLATGPKPGPGPSRGGSSGGRR